MMELQAGKIDRRITQGRLAVWLTVGLLTFLFLRTTWPLAWQVAVFGAAISLLWPFVRKGEGSRESVHSVDMGTGNSREEGNQSTIGNRQSAAVPCDPLCHSIEIGLDLMVATALIAVSGGFGSCFAPLVFVVVLEAFALLGQSAAIYASLAAGLLNLVHFRAGISPNSAILYGLALGTLGVSALVAGIAQSRPGSQGEGRNRRNTPLVRSPDLETLQEQLEIAERAREQMKDKYREVTGLHREQRAQIARMRVAEQLFEASVGLNAQDADGQAAFTRVLRLAMETVEAGGGVLWLRSRDGNALTAQAAVGRVADSIRLENITDVETLSCSALRARCETSLLRAASATRPPASRLKEDESQKTADERRAPFPLPSHASRLDSRSDSYGRNALSGSGATQQNQEEASFRLLTASAPGEHALMEAEDEWAAVRGNAAVAAVAPAVTLKNIISDAEFTRSQPVGGPPVVGVALLRGAETEAEPNGSILGALGVCDPHAQSRFLTAELERLQSLSRPLAAAVSNIAERAELNRRVREISLRYDLNCLTTTASGGEQAYEAIVEQVMQSVPCENCTLFLLDRGRQRLEAKATRGRVVNLLEHIGFERGHGVSGWVAAYGRPLTIADLTLEPNLLDVEMIPPLVRSFIAMPLRSGDEIVGVLNVSHARPHAFTSDDVHLLNLLSEQAALVIGAEVRI